jgi:methionine-rich copper-binding protein CopC
MNFVSKSVRRAFLSAFVAVLVLGVAPSAFAHSELVSSVPAANESTGSSPTELRLSFSEPVEQAFSKVKVTGPDKQPVELGKPTLDPADDKVMVVSVGKPLAKGAFVVDWSVVSSDGHKSSGRYTFDVK